MGIKLLLLKSINLLIHKWLNKFVIYISVLGMFFLTMVAMSTICLANTAQNRLSTVQQSIIEKEKNIQNQLRQRRELQRQLQQQEQMIAQAALALNKNNDQLKKINSQINVLEKKISELMKQQRQQKLLLANQLDIAFRLGKSTSLTFVLSHADSEKKQRIFSYFSYINQAREQLIKQLHVTQQEVSESKSMLQKHFVEQKQLVEKQKKENVKLSSANQQRKQTLVQLNQTLQKDQLKLTELKRDESALRASIEKAAREAKAREAEEAKKAEQLRKQTQLAKNKGESYTLSANEKSLMARTGGLGLPKNQYIWPTKGDLLHRFGEMQQGELSWKGIVIKAREGQKVKAIADGQVLLANWLRGYGLVLVISHGKGDMSLYGYNQSALVNVGDNVVAGQDIALVGNSGGQDSTSLYFEIRRQGQVVNPIYWLSKSL